MFKSLFGKLMTTYLIIMFIALALLGGTVAYLFQHYYFEEKQELLISQGREINSLVTKYLYGALTVNELSSKLETMDHILNARIWIVDASGLIYEESEQDENRWLGTRLEADEVSQILQGQVVTKVGRYGDRFDAAMLSVAVPLVINNQVRGATLLHLPVYGIEQSLAKVYRLIWAAALVSIALGSILVYFISRRFASPLHQMNTIALQLAQGRFGQRVEVYGEDEIAQLGVTFNFMAGQLDKLEQMRREFIANVSHELRSPLTSIRGFLQAILDGTVSAENQPKYLHMVFEEANRLTRLVNDLLDLARMESGNLQLDITVFSLNDLIDEVIFKLEPQAASKQVKLRVEELSEVFTVRGDHDRIQQIFFNLIANAINFTPADGSIEISTKVIKHKVQIAVKDTGIGIPEKDLEHIWERFHKVDKARTRSKSGTGLGLAIVKRLVAAHGEQIWVESKENEGTTFYFTLAQAKTKGKK